MISCSPDMLKVLLTPLLLNLQVEPMSLAILSEIIDIECCVNADACESLVVVCIAKAILYMTSTSVKNWDLFYVVYVHYLFLLVVS